jgi:hypothetical protein
MRGATSCRATVPRPRRLPQSHPHHLIHHLICPPPHHGGCKIHHTIGCYNDNDWRGGKQPGLVLPAYQASMHGRSSLESCAAACNSVKLSVAGVNDGSDCFCGAAADLEKPAVTARGRPKTECMATACDADPKEKECGGPGRLLAYHFTCP